MTPRAWRPLGAALAAALPLSLVAAGAPGRPLESPEPADVAVYAHGVAAATRTPTLADIRGARTVRLRSAEGEPVDIRVSPRYALAPERVQEWAAYVESLLHGEELATVVVYLAPPDEIHGICGRGAAACYSPADRLIVTPGEDLDAELTAEAVLAHEYGHHVSNSRANPPWRGIDYGTKRWATYAGVCRGVAAGELWVRGQGNRYRLDPAEGFAEAYRVANERRLGVPESPWEIVSERFYPDAVAAALIEQDVLAPWAANTARTFTSSFRPYAGKARTFRVATPLDGAVRATVRAPKGTAFRLSRTTATACGDRTTTFVVTRVKGYGSFTLTVSRP